MVPEGEEKGRMSNREIVVVVLAEVVVLGLLCGLGVVTRAWFGVGGRAQEAASGVFALGGALLLVGAPYLALYLFRRWIGLTEEER